ncbi:hypothetical protein ABID82_007201 [Methylobacterium sp. PvP062]|nr:MULTISPECIES: hypothetical protein [unclassified Methylobacterium]MBP2494678.1 hypothetical protein [Methylobacterium sp. PvP105]
MALFDPQDTEVLQDADLALDGPDGLRALARQRLDLRPGLPSLGVRVVRDHEGDELRDPVRDVRLHDVVDGLDTHGRCAFVQAKLHWPAAKPFRLRAREYPSLKSLLANGGRVGGAV